MSEQKRARTYQLAVTHLIIPLCLLRKTRGGRGETRGELSNESDRRSAQQWHAKNANFVIRLKLLLIDRNHSVAWRRSEESERRDT